MPAILDKMPELLRVTFEKSQARIEKNMPVFQESLQKKLSELEAKYSKKAASKKASSKSMQN